MYIKAEGSIKDTATGERLSVEIIISGDNLAIAVEGLGTFDCHDGDGSQIFVELHNKKLSVVAFDDINNQNPRTINMNLAKIDRRRNG